MAKREFGHKPQKLKYRPRPVAPVVTLMGREYHVQLRDGELVVTRLVDQIERMNTLNGDALFTEIELAIDQVCGRIFGQLPVNNEMEEAA